MDMGLIWRHKRLQAMGIEELTQRGSAAREEERARTGLGS